MISLARFFFFHFFSSVAVKVGELAATIVMAMSKEAAGLETGSDAEKKGVCAACMDVGDHRQAIKYCIDCAQLVCQNCVDYHRRFRQTKEHKLVEISKDDELKLSQMLSRLLICPSHHGKAIELVCKNHNVLCCLTCATVSHRGCKEVVEVASEALDPKQKSAMSELKNHLMAAKNHMDNIIKQHEKGNAEFINTTEILIPKELQKIKQKLLQTFNTLEQKILLECNLKRTSHVSKHTLEVNKWAKHIGSVNEAISFLTTAQENGSATHLYIVANKIQKSLTHVDAEIASQGNTLPNEIVYLKEGFTLKQFLSGKSHDRLEVCLTDTLDPLLEYQFTKTSPKIEGQWLQGSVD